MSLLLLKYYLENNEKEKVNYLKKNLLPTKEENLPKQKYYIYNHQNIKNLKAT